MAKFKRMLFTGAIYVFFAVTEPIFWVRDLSKAKFEK